MFDWLVKILEYLPKLWRCFTSPLNVQVRQVRYNLIKNSPRDYVVVITAYPSYYYVEFDITNRSGAEVFLKDIVLRVNDAKTFRPTDKILGESLRVHQPKTLKLKFDAPEEDAPAQYGFYKLEVIPTHGRKRIIKGEFPSG